MYLYIALYYLLLSRKGRFKSSQYRYSLAYIMCMVSHHAAATLSMRIIQ
jgi:hypothetical protein